MSYTIDANILIYASDAESPLHGRATEFLERMAAGPEIAYLLWPTTMAYLRIATHPTIFATPLTPQEAIGNVQAILDLPHIQTPGEHERFWDRYLDIARDVPPAGNLVPDTHLVALMIENGVRVIWTHDRDYRKFRGITVRDPFEGDLA